ncbi:CYTH domain-containing protein [Rossellomorea sp. NS-SX7]|uniref:CYTH domain-containing protein n=1 Tax=Rossellomorea sp. NS-SX7 TaxID=3463856 RepID=UPI004058A549
MNVKEQELKLLLDAEGFKQLLANKPTKILKQINYYFDTPRLDLKESGITLRIREENEEVILCMKMKVKKAMFVTSDEVQRNISEEVLSQCIEHPDSMLDYLPESSRDLILSLAKNEKLRFLGTIKNTRHCLNFDNNFTFELDHSEFPHRIQSYELEIEGVSNQEDCEYILDVLKEKQITFQLNGKSKYERFLMALNKADTNK